MPVKVSWYDRDRIIFLDWSGEITEEDIKQLNQSLIQYYVESAQPRVHIVMDQSKLEKDANIITYGRYLREASQHPKLGWVLDIGAINPAGDIITMLIMKLFKMRYKRLALFDHIEAWLKEYA